MWSGYICDFSPATTMNTRCDFDLRRHNIEGRHPAAVFLSCCLLILDPFEAALTGSFQNYSTHCTYQRVETRF